MNNLGLHALLARAQSAGVSVYELRPPRGSVSESDDFDLLCPSSKLTKFVSVLLEMSKENSFSFEITQRKYSKTVIHIYAGESCFRRKIEIWHALRFRGGDSGKYSHVVLPGQLTSKVYPFLVDSEAWGAVFFSLFFLARMRIGSAMDYDDVTRVKYFREEVVDAASALGSDERVLRVANTLSAVIEEGRISGICKRNVFSIMEAFGVEPKAFKKLEMRETVLFVNRLVTRKASRSIPFCGADGSGKSSLIKRVRAHGSEKGLGYLKFRTVFQNSYLFKILYYPARLMEREADKKVTEHRLGWWAIVSARVGMPGMTKVWTLVDRWFYDYLVKDVKFTAREPRRLGRGLTRLLNLVVPRPSALVVTFCSQQSLDARKGEMNEPAVRMMEQVYVERILGDMVYPAMFCNTDQSFECCAEQINHFIDSVSSRPPRTFYNSLIRRRLG